tara:strand:+ start:1747 stop:2157 length:411 start_codon:yes stop_codon:yes gene_type:complete
MALTLVATDGNANPGTSHGRAMDRIGIGGAPIAGVGKLWWSSYLIDLENTAYVTGGVPIPVGTCGYSRIFDMMVLAGKDPYGSADVTHVTTGLTFTLDSTNPAAPKLVIEDDAGEVANASTQAAGSRVWVCFGGLR